MTRRTAGVCLGLAMTVSCSGGPQAPSPVNTQTPQPPPTAAPPTGPPMTSIVGTYSASLLLPACTGLPESDRQRTYTARIDENAQSGVHVVTLGGGTFLESPPSRFHPVPLHPNQFLASYDQSQASFMMFADWESSFGGRIVERTSAGRWIMVEGRLTGRATGDTIIATGAGEAFYCDAARDSFWDECTGFAVLCGTPLTLTLVRR